ERAGIEVVSVVVLAAELATRREDVAGPGDDEHAQIRIAVEPLDGLSNAEVHVRGQRVAALGAIDGDPRDRPVLLPAQESRRHLHGPIFAHMLAAIGMQRRPVGRAVRIAVPTCERSHAVRPRKSTIFPISSDTLKAPFGYSSETLTRRRYLLNHAR